ncbi:MAG TPA: STAS domain-containing protein [Acidimicrobiales bacterium]
MSEQAANLEIVDRSAQAVAARLAGDLDIVTSENVKRELSEVFDSGATALTLDLGDVRFVDSSGLGTLVALHRYAEAAGSTFTVRSVPPQVQRLFEITRLDDLLAVETD